MACVALENIASISTDTTGSVGKSGSITRLTRKCFCLAMGLTAVHLVNSSFLGFSGFMCSANSGAVFHFPRHGLPQFNHRHGVVAAPVVAGDDVKVIGTGDEAGRIGAVEQLDQGQWSLVL